MIRYTARWMLLREDGGCREVELFFLYFSRGVESASDASRLHDWCIIQNRKEAWPSIISASLQIITSLY